ncbi:transposase [Listeria monocytogenes]|nr:transposase [Listeria monocytogenes]EAC4079736.1 transposase [Listeria monocytogenes]EAD2306522.1 transposase [Listeria monocytogenes]EAD2318782.1 transposase [Listeria monocytogenes]EAD2321889.1 transposase [Listeria monocytogenes]
MNLSIGYLLPENKVSEITKKISGYFENDIWEANNAAFNDFRKSEWGKTHRKMNFSAFPSKLKNEVKFFILTRIEKDELQLYSAIHNYARSFKQLSKFLKKFYPHINSFADLDTNKALIQLRTHLIELGLSTRIYGRRKLSNYENLLNRLFLFYKDFYDTRDEFEKDIWDVRNIPGARFPDHESRHILNFEEIPETFRPLAKRYLKFRISHLSLGQCTVDVRILKLFLTFIHEKNPAWKDLNALTRKDIEDYLVFHNQKFHDKIPSKRSYLIVLNVFLETIEKLQCDEAPALPVNLLLFKEDIPRPIKKSEYDIKYIPEGVLQQIEDKLEFLKPSKYIPIIVLLRATGWRISDILNLRYDNCLEQTSQGWYLCGDIKKTQVMNHRVPITKEVAGIVEAVIKAIKEQSDTINNPKNYLFGQLNGVRRGRPYNYYDIHRSLKRFSEEQCIVDDLGNPFFIKNHAFRHTKGVELLNNGMNILHVQKWMAHASPEMTLQYAKILDTTMRKSWEEATKQGVFRIDIENRRPVKIELTDIANEDIIEWEYIRHNLDAVKMELGYCMKPIKQPCPTQANPCLSCRNFCTTPEFIPKFEMEIKEVKSVIERGISLGRQVWIDKNQSILNRLEPILETLKDGTTHHLAGKKGREYIGKERTHEK